MSSSAADLYRLYFLAIVPPSPLYEEALALKHHFKDHYNSKASLNSPAAHHAAHAVSLARGQGVRPCAATYELYFSGAAFQVAA